MIGFNVPIFIDESIECIKEAINKRKICGDGDLQKNVVNGWKKNLIHLKFY